MASLCCGAESMIAEKLRQIQKASGTFPIASTPSLWLDASDSTKFTYSSGALVSSWFDKSGNNYEFKQTATGKQPTRNTSVQAGKAGVTFSGGQLLSAAAYNFSSSPFTVFIVAKKTTGSGNEGIFGVATYGGMTLAAYGGAIPYYQMFLSNVRVFYFNQNPPIEMSNAQVLAYKSTGVGAFTSYITIQKNLETAIYTATDTNFQPSTSLSIGGSYETASYTDSYYGSILEIIAFNSVLSSSDSTTMKTYLLNKWGLPTSNTALLLHMDGTNGSTTFTDSGPNALTMTASGTPTISTSQSVFGGASLSLNGSSYLTAANNASNALGIGDFTIECWVNFASTPASNVNMGIANIMSSAGAAVTTMWWLGLYNPAGVMRLHFGRHGDGSVYAYVNWTPSTNTWYHIAVTRSSSSVISLFINGVSQSVTSSGSNWVNDFSSNGILAIGYVATAAPFNGYIDEFRIKKGEAVYTGTFTPSGPLS